MSLLSTGVSGLTAARQALDITGNNISNAYTRGFHRETVTLTEGLGGDGVQLQTAQRQFNQHVTAQHNAAQSAHKSLAVQQSQITQIGNLLADLDSGLAPMMQDFFSALDDLAGSPSDPSVRQGVIGTANTLSAQFRTFGGYLDDMQSGIDGMIRDEITHINTSAEQVAGLNREIGLAQARLGEPPNDLLNQRDRIVAELNEHLDVTLIVQDGKTYNLYLPSGQPLVTGSHAQALEATASAADPQRLVVGYRESRDTLTEISDARLKGGSLGGILAFRSEALDKAQNQIGQMAVSLAEGLNAQHRQGINLNGDRGGDMFSVGAPVIYRNEHNLSETTAQVSLGSYDLAAEGTPPLDDLRQLNASDYEIRFSGDPAEVAVRRLDTGAALAKDTDFTLSDDGSTLTFGGLQVSFNGTPQNGDRFLVQPLKQAARGMTNALGNNTNAIAAAQQGGLSGDNRNALALQTLQGTSLVGGRATLSQAYATLVSDIGNQSHVIGTNLQSQQAMSEQLRGLQQAESGVNLDEEAANLIRYQQYYQANAKVIEVGSVIIDTLLGLRT